MWSTVSPMRARDLLPLAGSNKRSTLEDGSVWVWEYTADANTSLALLFGGPICGLALAVVLVLGLWLAVGVRALVRRRKAKE
jgi:hypothetical protein